MTTLYVDRRGVELKVNGDALVFFENGARVGTVPLNPLSRIFLRGDVGLSSSLLAKLGELNIGVVVLSGRKAIPTMLLGRPHNDAARRIAQYRLSQDDSFCLKFAMRLVAAKLQSQKLFLSAQREQSPMSRYVLTHACKIIENAIASVSKQNSMAALRGVEGAAAATYFGAYAELCPPRYQFSHRNRRPPKDPINAVLSLGYTLLHAEAVLAAYGAGIDPFIGFYHALDFGRESLACDIVEPLRADVDSHTLNLFRSEILRTDDFSFNNDACLMGKAGRVRFYTEWQRVAEGLRKKLEEQVSDLTQLMARNEPVSKVVACSSTANTERPADLS